MAVGGASGGGGKAIEAGKAFVRLDADDKALHNGLARAKRAEIAEKLGADKPKPAPRLPRRNFANSWR